MNKDINEKLETLENQKLKFLKCFELISDEKLNTQPAKDKWSLAQILYHIVKAEQGTLLSFMNSIRNGNNLNKVGSKAFIKSKFLNLALKSNLKFKAPPVAQKVPDNVNVKEISNKWDEIRKDIKNACLKIPEENYNKGIFKHPYIGLINLEQSLNFLINHINHHLQQVEKISCQLNQN
ncbi:MAG: hypothetical protein COW08_01925 [Ignavibacteriales bacterium CG12_big_fil_rev_8_21_14_0_65_30_8]|nr:MAG: hypothetical protein COW08_01925 [Ignavibacteriales bacterium CG12_big_fil_rev_8_21_14_0_65_30_8]